MKKRWTKEDTQYLIDNYEAYKNETKALAKKLNRSEDAIQWKASKLGLTQKENYWSEKEVAFVIKNREYLTYVEMADHLNRTRPAIAHQIQELKKKGIIK
jgi:DNA-binding MarR family transcriptional regulator